MNSKHSRPKVLRLGLGVASMGVAGNLVSDTKSEQAPDSEEAKMKSKEIETKKIKLADRASCAHKRPKMLTENVRLLDTKERDLRKIHICSFI